MLFSDKELREILLSEDQDFLEELYRNARETAKATFSNKIYIRPSICQGQLANDIKRKFYGLYMTFMICEWCSHHKTSSDLVAKLF